MTVCLQHGDGRTIALPVQRWMDEAPDDEVALLARVRGPVLDVGCGPGRHVLALNRRGAMALGIDTSPKAVALARQRGATALVRSVFEPMPGEGRWGSVLLLDGNIGIGGDPVVLLRRTRALVARGGTVLVELEPRVAGRPAVERLAVRIRSGGRPGPWFPWARVGADAIGTVAGHAGLRVTGVTDWGSRCFAWLAR